MDETLVSIAMKEEFKRLFFTPPGAGDGLVVHYCPVCGAELGRDTLARVLQMQVPETLTPSGIVTFFICQHSEEVCCQCFPVGAMGVIVPMEVKNA